MAYSRKNLGDILIEDGILSREELDDVIEKSSARDLSLEETLFKLGFVSRDTLGVTLAKLHNCTFIDLCSCSIDDNALRYPYPGDRQNQHRASCFAGS